MLILRQAFLLSLNDTAPYSPTSGDSVPNPPVGLLLRKQLCSHWHPQGACGGPTHLLSNSPHVRNSVPAALLDSAALDTTHVYIEVCLPFSALNPAIWLSLPAKVLP